MTDKNTEYNEDEHKEHVDGWANLFTKLGTSYDSRRRTNFYEAHDLHEKELHSIYRHDKLARKIIELPVETALQEGITIRVADDPDTQSDAQSYIETNNTLKTIKEAKSLARLYGGCVLVLGVDDGRSMSEPVDFDRIRSIRYMLPLDRYHCSVYTEYNDIETNKFGTPESYRIDTYEMLHHHHHSSEITGLIVHADRVLHFDGLDVTRRQRIINQGFGDPVLQPLWETLRAYGVGWAAVEQILTAYEQTIFKIKGLNSMIASGGEAAVLAKLQTMQQARSMINAVLLDAQDEEFERQTSNVQGLADLLKEFINRVASDAEIPATILFGMSPAGMNATGESDLENWHKKVSSIQNNEIRPQIEKLLKIIFSSEDGPTGGKEPESWFFNFAPLKQMSEADRADIHLKQAQADAIYLDRNVLSASEVAGSRFGGDEFSTDTVLDDEVRQIMEQAERDELEGRTAPASTQNNESNDPDDTGFQSRE